MEAQIEESIITMYHLDKDRLMMTHYCSAQNQPRMQANISDDGKTFTFDFLDATNLANPADGNMRKMVLTVLDKDDFTEQWLFNKDGKDETGTFHLIRKKVTSRIRSLRPVMDPVDISYAVAYAVASMLTSLDNLNAGSSRNNTIANSPSQLQAKILLR